MPRYHRLIALGRPQQAALSPMNNRTKETEGACERQNERVMMLFHISGHTVAYEIRTSLFAGALTNPVAQTPATIIVARLGEIGDPRKNERLLDGSRQDPLVYEQTFSADLARTTLPSTAQ